MSASLAARVSGLMQAKQSIGIISLVYASETKDLKSLWRTMMDPEILARLDRIEKVLNLPVIKKPEHKWELSRYGTGHYDERTFCSECGLEQHSWNEWKECVKRQ